MSRDYGRRSQGDLAYGDDFYADRRWDRSRFERERARARAPTFEREPPRSRDDFFEEDRYREVDYYPSRRSRPAFMERDYYETAGREVAPYSHRWEPEREPERPKYVRRQSSWDEHDRRPRPRYGDKEAELDVDIRINQQEAPPPRRYYPEEDEYRDVRIVRERERSVYRRDRSESRPRRHESSESEEVEEEAEEEIIEKPKKEKKPKRGKTKMPKRLVHKRAIIDLGYPFEEEADFFIVFVAMNKDQIDQAIKISETYRIVYKDDDTPKQLEAPPEKEDTPPESPQNEVVETVTTKIIENPTSAEYEHYIHPDGNAPENDNASSSPAPSRSKSRRGRSRSTHHSTHGEEEEEEDKFTTMTVVDRSRRSDRDIKAEIRQLEAERKALRSERDKSRYSSERREVDFDVSERSDRDVVRIEKDSRDNLELVRPHKSRSRSRRRSRRINPAIVNTALRTLT